MTNQLPRLRRVNPGDVPRTLELQWAAGTRNGAREIVDLTGVIARFKPFAPLLDQAVFATAHVIDNGIAIAWEGGLDFSGSSLLLLAEEQQAMSAAELRAWQDRFAISNSEAAHTLGVSLRSYAYYCDGRAIPKALAAFVRAMAREPAVFAAHYRPTAKAGRPRVMGTVTEAQGVLPGGREVKITTDLNGLTTYTAKRPPTKPPGKAGSNAPGWEIDHLRPIPTDQTGATPTRAGGKIRRHGGDAA